jgi:hypothetical protein
MGMLDSIGLGGGSSSDQKSTTEPWSKQQPYLEQAFKGAQNLYQQGPNQYYGGDTIAGTNPAIQGYLQGMGGYYQGGLDAAGAMQGYGADLAGGLPQSQQFYSQAMGDYYNPYASAEYSDIIANSVANNPVLQNQIRQGQQDINRNMQENILPSIANSAVGTGNVGSSRRGVAEGIAMRGAMEQGSDLATNLQANAYNQGINQAGQWAGGEQFGQNYGMNAANQMTGLGQYGLGQMGAGYGLGTQAYQDLLGAGAYERGMEQEGINADRERFDFEQNAPWDNLARYQQAISGNYGGSTRSSGGGASSGNQLMQMGTQLGSAYMMGQSDRRLKENIEKVGEIDGINIYTWDWKPEYKDIVGDQPAKGFIADEVPSHMRFAGISGFDMVDYSGYPEVRV